MKNGLIVVEQLQLKMLSFFQGSGKKETSFLLLLMAQLCLVGSVSLGVQSCCPATAETLQCPQVSPWARSMPGMDLFSRSNLDLKSIIVSCVFLHQLQHELKSHEKALLFWMQLLGCHFPSFNVKFWSFLSFWNTPCSLWLCWWWFTPTPQLSHQESRATPSYPAQDTLKGSITNTKDRTLNTLPALPLLKPLCHSPSLQGQLPAGEGRTAMSPKCAEQHPLQSSHTHTHTPCCHSSHPVPCQECSTKCSCWAQKQQGAETTLLLLRKGTGKPLLNGHKV